MSYLRKSSNEAVITHELTVRFAQDGSFRYLGNKILNGGTKDIPEYQYLCRGSEDLMIPRKRNNDLAAKNIIIQIPANHRQHIR